MPYLLLFCGLASASYLDRAEVREFIDEMNDRHGLNRAELKDLFKHIERRDEVIEAISRPAERVLRWRDYRKIFVTDKRLAGGVKFWRAHRELLARAENKYGVPASIIVAIIGVETFFGRHQGRHPAFASLATLAFDYPQRSAFFRAELEQFLLLSKDESLDPLQVMGSYAAALGMPQFISSSYRHYAVDFDGDGRRDLWGSIADVTGSVANYFRRHGWRRGEPVAERVVPGGGHYKKLIAKKLKPTISDAQLRAAEIELTQVSTGPKALYSLIGEAGEELWVGHKNFYVITRYNHSVLYAMAVYQLSRQLESAIAE